MAFSQVAVEAVTKAKSQPLAIRNRWTEENIP